MSATPPDAGAALRDGRAEARPSTAPFPALGQRARDVLVAALLFAGVVVYLSLLPRHLGVGDESYFLYESKRIRDGEVMYRDFFQFVTPLSSYATAGLFWLFGTTMATARIALAVLHGAIGVILYATARGLGVRRALAVLVVLAHLAICAALYHYASWHWYGTLSTAVLVLVLVVGPWGRRPRWAVVPGLASGILIGVQQQKGVVLAVGVGLLFVLDHLMDRRYPSPEPRSRLATRLACFAAGIAVIVVPLLALFAVLAGPEPIYAALVRFPLESYRTKVPDVPWGALAPLGQEGARYTFPLVLRYAPAALVLPFLACVADWRLRRDRERVRGLASLTVLSGFSALSITYYPDLIHLAFIASGFWLCAALGLEWVVSGVRPVIVGRLASVLILAAIGASLVWHLAGCAQLLRRQYPVAHDTAFGRLDLSARWEALFIDRVRDLLAQSPTAELFCYRVLSPYLTTGGRNPTPYQFLNPLVSPGEHTRNTLSILDERRVAYVVTSALFMRSDDPIARFIEANYTIVPMPDVAASGEWIMLALYARKDL